MKRFLIFCLVTVLSNNVNAQNSLFQDSKGESAFKVFDNSIIFNAADANLGLNFNAFSRSANASNTEFDRVGFNLKVTTNEGVANLKNDNGFLVDGEIGIYYGKKFTSDPTADMSTPGWASETFISSNLLVDRNKFYNGQDINQSTFNQGELGYKVEIGNFGWYGDILYGVAFNIQQQDNIEDIKQNTISTIITSGNNNAIQTLRQENAYNILEYKENQNSYNINGDFAFLLNPEDATVLVNNKPYVPPIHGAFHFRFTKLQGAKPMYNPAIGLYLNQTGAPRNVVTGFNIQLLDAFNVEDSDNSTFERTTINLTAGFKF